MLIDPRLTLPSPLLAAFAVGLFAAFAACLAGGHGTAALGLTACVGATLAARGAWSYLLDIGRTPFGRAFAAVAAAGAGLAATLIIASVVSGDATALPGALCTIPLACAACAAPRDMGVLACAVAGVGLGLACGAGVAADAAMVSATLAALARDPWPTLTSVTGRARS